MVLHGKYRKNLLRKLLLPVGFLLLMFSLTFGLVWLNKRTTIDLYCDTETVVEEEEKLYFRDGGTLFRNGHTQSDSTARSGKFSSLLEGKKYFGPAVTLKVTGGQDLVARAWKKNMGTGYGAIVAQGDWGFYASQSLVLKKDAEGWEQIGVRVKVPSDVKFSKLTFYCWLVPDRGGKVIYDDFSVVEAADSLENILPASNEPHLDEEEKAIISIMPVGSFPVRAHLEHSDAQQTLLSVKSFSTARVKIRGIGQKNQLILTPPQGGASFEPYVAERIPEYREITFNGEGDHIFFKVEGIDSLFSEPITPWPLPRKRRVPSQYLFDSLQIGSNDLYELNGTEIRFRVDSFSVRKPLIFPEGYRILFPAGCALNFLDSAYFLSRSPVFVEGTASRPVQFLSSDESAKGFTVLNAGESRIAHLNVVGFGTMEVDGWNLTGALTFYETDMDIEGLNIIGNHCEDALNIVRSRVEVRELRIEKCFSDAFDCDFCQGNIRSVEIFDSGNDGLDFSGSQLNIEQARVYRPGDKGISVGENSRLELNYYRLEGGNIGLASKDLSEVNAQYIELSGVGIGFAAFQKKPEFGPGRIVVKEFREEGVKTLHAIESGSELILEGLRVRSR